MELLLAKKKGNYNIIQIDENYVPAEIERKQEMCIRDRSRIMINPFIKKKDIDISVCQKNEFDSYNDFFKRKLVPGARAIAVSYTHLDVYKRQAAERA